MINKKRGFAMLEMLLVVGLLAGMFTMYYKSIYKPQKNALDYEMSLKKELSLRNFIKNYILLAASYNVNKSIDGKSENIRLEPINGETSNGKKSNVTFYLNKNLLKDNKILKSQLKLLRCHIVGTKSSINYGYLCPTGEKNSYFKYTVDYNRATGDNDWNNIYDSIYPIFQLEKITKDGKQKYKGAITYKFSYSDIYENFKNQSISKLEDIKNRIKNFHKTQLLKELRNNCTETTGGLDSWDDTFVPWVWLVNSTQDKKYQRYICTDNDGTCDCKLYSLNNTDKKIIKTELQGSKKLWQTSSNFLRYDSFYSPKTGGIDRWGNMLKNLDLPKNYYTTDAVGNIFQIIFFSDGSGNILKFNGSTYTPPPLPGINYNDKKQYNYKTQGELNIIMNNPAQLKYNNTSVLFLYE